MVAEDDPKGFALLKEKVQPRLDNGETPAEIAKALGLEEAQITELIDRSEKPYCQRDGPALFREVREVIQQHYHFEKAWHYVVSSLFVFQSKCANALPAVFYLFFGGAKGSGKTNILDLLCALCNGVKCENISVSALARLMENGKGVFVDEIDADRGKENNEVRDALLRQGYKANAAPYTRWDMATKAPEQIPVYGPKAATYRSTIRDDALRDRGFQIPAVKAQGESGYEYVLANFWPSIEDLPSRLDKWGADALEAFPPTKLKELAYSSEFRKKVKASVEKLGANRESELVTVALLVAEMAGVDVVEELQVAVKTRDVADEDIADDLEELSEVVRGLAVVRYGKVLDEAPAVRIKQSEIKAEMKKRRNERRDRPLTDQKLALLRRELGVEDAWLTKPGNALMWNLPQPFLSTLANKANMANSDTHPDWQDPCVNQVSHVRQGEGLPVGSHETQADRCLGEYNAGATWDELAKRYPPVLLDQLKIPRFGGREE